MRVDIVTKEFPPNIYGGAGVHVAELSRSLARHLTLKVHAFGSNVEPDYHGAEVFGYPDLADLSRANGAVKTLGTDLAIVDQLAGTDLIHTHTWYANMAGHLGGLLHGVPHVLSAHSLEPLRPWKAEQLGGGYALSSWAESTTYHSAAGVIAVSDGMRKDILRCYPDIDPNKVTVIHNGIDTEYWSPNRGTDALEKYGIDPNRPIVSFVGRITRQKGVPYLLRAAAQLPEDAQLVLCVGAPDTPELAAEVNGLIEDLKNTRTGVIVVEGMIPRAEVIQILTASTLFACPSIYEPLGIVNLEAMACETAVVASAVGGIPEVVAPGQTGELVSLEQVSDGTGTPVDEEKFVNDFAEAMNKVLADPDLASRYGKAGRERARQHFSWEAIAEQTIAFYQTVLNRA